MLVGIAFAAVAIPVIWRQVRRKMLWSLRNKLVLTYLLIGLAPVVLFVTLVTVAAYIAAGQFAIHILNTRLESHLDEVKGLNSLDAWTLEQRLRTPGQGAADGLATMRFTEPQLQGPEGTLVPQMRLFRSGLQINYEQQRPTRVADAFGPAALGDGALKVIAFAEWSWTEVSYILSE